MSYPSVTNTYVNGTTIDGPQFNQNFTDIINGLSDGSKDLNINALTAAGAITPSIGILLNDGSAGTPSLRFGSDVDTGIFWGGVGNQFRLVSGGSTTAIIGSQVLGGDGSSSAPMFSFFNQTSLGWYRSSSGNHGMIANLTGTHQFFIQNLDATSGASQLSILTASGSSGDGFILISEASGTSWALGRDDSDSSSFKLSKSSTLGTSDFLTIPTTGSVILNNAALATTATDGFLYVAACAGAPTGVATSATGRVPLVYDSSNNKFYVYNGGWKGVTLS